MSEEYFTNNAYLYKRWSTSSQGEDGHDSDRRQSEMVPSLCKRYGLKLIDTFIDDGVSSKRGKNKTHSLGELLKVIRPGDTILTEDFDRLQREAPDIALQFIGNLVKEKGVRIITTMDGNEITKNTFNSTGGFITTAIKIQLAYEESEKKSKRIKEAWVGKRKALSEGKKIRMTHLPPWLEYNNSEYTINEEKAQLVKRIFDLYNKGHGTLSIAHILNKENVPTLTKIRRTGVARRDGRCWYEGNIARLLQNKAVLGYCNYVEPAVKIFPPIIDEKVFWMAVSKRKERHSKNYSGRGNSMINPFKSLLYCAKCGGTCYNSGGWSYDVVFHKVSKTRLIHYLRCWNAKHAKCNEKRYLRYDDFEKSFIEILKTDHVAALLMGETQSTSKLEVLNGKLMDCQRQQKKLTALIMGDDSPSVNLMRELKELEGNEKQLLQEINTETLMVSGTTAPAEALKKYKSEFDGKFLDPNYRREIGELLRGMVEKIVLNLEEHNYDIWFKGASKAVRVFITAGGYLIQDIKFPNQAVKPEDPFFILEWADHKGEANKYVCPNKPSVNDVKSFIDHALKKFVDDQKGS